MKKKLMASPLFITCFLLIFLYSVNSDPIVYTVDIEHASSKPAVIYCTIRQDVFKRVVLPGVGPNYIDIPIIPQGDNKITCDIDLIVLGTLHVHFDLFNFDRDRNNCDDGHFCSWEIQKEGVCMGSKTDCKLFFMWNK